MANIKCRYVKPRCWKGFDCIDISDEDMRVCMEEWWHCKNYKPDKKQLEEHPNLVNPRCEHLWIADLEFEKTVKSYSFDPGCALSLRGLQISVDDIKYLEIDGRVLISEENDQ